MSNLIKNIYNLKFTIISVGVIMYLSFAKFDVDPNDIPKFEHFDKVVHFGMYAALAMAYCVDRYSAIKVANYKRVILAAASLIVTLGIFTELVQGQISYRGCDIYDFVADTTGGVVGLILGLLFIPKLYPKVTKLLFKIKQ